MYQSSPDVVYDQNNGVIAVKPTATGRLAKLVRRTADGSERVWVFADLDTWTDVYGNERIDHRRRGVTNGTHYDGRLFLDICGELGLKVQSQGFFVPFSNSQRRHGQFRDGAPTADYTEEELRLTRWDLPSRADLELIVMK